MHSKFQNDDIEVVARRISKLLIGQKTPISVDHICQKLKDVESDMLKKVIDKYQNHFHVFQQPVVKLMTKIDICKIHCSKNRSCPGTEPLCTGLHICKYYILSSKCHFDKHCTFGHDVRTDHNMKILQENLLADITVDELKFLLSSADNRTSLTVPRICKFYNVENDKCRHSERGSLCPDIHICKHFVLGTCKFGKDCLRSHSVLEKRNSEILSKHGIDVNKTETEIIKDLRKGISGTASSMAETEGIRLFDLKSESVASTSVETVFEIAKSISCPELELEVIKKEESFREETIHREANTGGGTHMGTKTGRAPVEANIPQIRVNLAVDNVQFRYMSEITEKKKKKSRQNSVADVMFENYHGYATVIAYCVDCDDTVHPYYLYGDNCKDGVYVKTSKLEQEKSVMIQGVYVCTPRIVDYQTRIDSTRSKLVENGITDVEKCDEKTVDKQCVYLKVVVVLGESTKKLSVTTTALQNKKNLKVKDVQSDHATIPGQKRTSFDCSQKNDVKRRRKSIANNKGDAQPRFFQRFYSRPDTEQPWGNFIDTAGYQESALTWKAQGEALQSVCMICYPGGCATGFRVGTGKNYIMTAAHVCRFILQSERGRVGWTTRNALKNPDVFAAFDYLKEGELKEKKKFHFKEHVHFTNDELDTAVLELEEHPDGTPMPPPLKYFQQPDFTKEFFFIGHSEGKPLAINKVDKVVDMQSDNAKQDIINIRNLSLQHTVSQEYPNGRGYELEPYHTLENQHRYLFHCKFTQGASGSPGLVFLNDGRKVVVSMLLCGYPVWYYDPDMEKFRTNWSKDCHCVEQGVNLSSVHAFMSKENPELCNDIFCQ